MGIGIARQIGSTPGMELVFVGDLKESATGKAKEAYQHACSRRGNVTPGTPFVTHEPLKFLDSSSHLENFDLLVEATNSIEAAALHCLSAFQRRAHVVLMNAEVDLALGPYLARQAECESVTISSDGGDQHGVLMKMVDEIRLWGFDITMTGNIKGFLDRHATPSSMRSEAQKRRLDPIQCCAYTDGTKLNIEMALISNGTGLIPSEIGMQGPEANHVTDVFDLFDFGLKKNQGVVDYILGAEPGGGVFVVGYCDDPLQMEYLKYYKMGNGPYYLFYRPYHLCHLETIHAIVSVALFRNPILT